MLRNVIRNLIIESRYVSPMEYTGLACKFYDPSRPAYTYYLLFDPQVMRGVEYLYEGFGESDPASSADQNKFLNYIKSKILGFAEVKKPTQPCNGAVEVKNLAAESPYGPTVYDIVLADNPGIVSDVRGTEEGAVKVYEKYLFSRDDVEVRYLDSPRTKSTRKFAEDDCDRDYYPMLNTLDSYGLKAVSDISNSEKAITYDDYPYLLDDYLDQEQLFGISFHMNNQNIEYEVSDLLQDPFEIRLADICMNVFGVNDGYTVLRAAGKQYFDRKYKSN